MSRTIKNPSPTTRDRPTTRLSASESARKTRSSVAKAAAANNKSLLPYRYSSSVTTKPPFSPSSTRVRGKNKIGKKGTAVVIKKDKGKKGKGKGKSEEVVVVNGGGADYYHQHHPMTDGHNDENNDKEEQLEATKYWLVKSEPESRVHKGKDVKFSLDDLEASGGAVAWDGVRNLAARNNMRAMSKGDKAFFYHSNCKVPGIVGIAEIVKEHTVDDSAHDPESPYYDPKSTPTAPKWSVVHVEFRERFKEIISLKELNTYKQPGGVLADMQALRQSRLSVSKVTKEEWDFIVGLAEEQEIEEEEEAKGEKE